MVRPADDFGAAQLQARNRIGCRMFFEDWSLMPWRRLVVIHIAIVARKRHFSFEIKRKAPLRGGFREVKQTVEV